MMNNQKSMTIKGKSLSERLNIGSEFRELKIGESFNKKNAKKNATAFHTIKYDSKSAAVDANQVATVDIDSNNELTITAPNKRGSRVPQTVYKGRHTEHTRDCVIIIDKKTGQMTLERLDRNIQVKEIRAERAEKPAEAVTSKAKEDPDADVVATGARKKNVTETKKPKQSKRNKQKRQKNNQRQQQMQQEMEEQQQEQLGCNPDKNADDPVPTQAN